MISYNCLHPQISKFVFISSVFCGILVSVDALKGFLIYKKSNRSWETAKTLIIRRIGIIVPRATVRCPYPVHTSQLCLKTVTLQKITINEMLQVKKRESKVLWSISS